MATFPFIDVLLRGQQERLRERRADERFFSRLDQDREFAEERARVAREREARLSEDSAIRRDRAVRAEELAGLELLGSGNFRDVSPLDVTVPAPGVPGGLPTTIESPPDSVEFGGRTLAPVAAEELTARKAQFEGDLERRQRKQEAEFLGSEAERLFPDDKQLQNRVRLRALTGSSVDPFSDPQQPNQQGPRNMIEFIEAARVDARQRGDQSRVNELTNQLTREQQRSASATLAPSRQTSGDRSREISAKRRRAVGQLTSILGFDTTRLLRMSAGTKEQIAALLAEQSGVEVNDARVVIAEATETARKRTEETEKPKSSGTPQVDVSDLPIETQIAYQKFLRDQ